MPKPVFLPLLLVSLFFYTPDAYAQSLGLPAGFSSSIIAEGLGGARHLAITPDGGIYVKLSRLRDGKGIVYLKDNNGDGKYAIRNTFGDFPGTGIAIRSGYLYASSNDAVYRYRLDKGGNVVNPGSPEKIVMGLVDHKRDNAKSIALDNKGDLFVVVGSYLNACLVDPNSTKSPDPCPILDSVGGVWQFKTDRADQKISDAVHYATGFKNIVGITWNAQSGSLFVMQHGRGDLNSLFPNLYTPEQDKKLPAETMYEVRKGADGGWPYVYYDQFQHKKILAPEYGGDGKKTGNRKSLNPIAVMPAHLGPNDVMFYTSNAFPAKFHNGAFIAFHGKSPELDKGYLVAFVPFRNGKPAGNWEVFADNFLSGKDQHKPCGLAQGPDGSLFVCDDANGSIYKISYRK